MGTEDDENALRRLLEHIDTTISRDPSSWSRWPGGWPGEIGTALVDAVYSARATYLTKHGKGVLPLVKAWQAKAGTSTSTLSALADEIRDATPEAWAKDFGSEQHSPGRSAAAEGGPWKSAAVLEAATLLGKLPVNTADNITDQNARQVKSVLMSVQGIGFATSNYFLMLLGRPGVKPDRMVHRFLEEATGKERSNSAAAGLVVEAARSIGGVEPHELDHAIWRYESDRARSAGSTERPGV